MGLPSNYIHARPPAVPFTSSVSSGPTVQATHISLSGIQSNRMALPSAVLGPGHRGDKSFIRLALERAEGAAAAPPATCSCTWSDLWGAGAGSPSASGGSGRP